MPATLKKSVNYTGDTISVYHGEFLTTPIPLELSFNYCSHKCGYCFANLNRPDRRADVKATLNLLRDFQTRDTLQARLLQSGYPVLISNRVDPFAASNHRVALPVMELMTALGIPIALQTRGGTGIDEALDFLKPSCWYVSISQLDDAIRKRVEPGAPSIESRFDLIAKLKARGHRVVLGLNALVPEWLHDPLPLLERARTAGAEGAWIELLHFNRDQVARLSPRERDAIGETVIRRAVRRSNRDDWPFFEYTRRMAVEAGLEVFSIGQPNRSDFFRPYTETYPALFPTMQEATNKCHDDGFGPSDLIDADEFIAYFAAVLPQGKQAVSHYLGATAANVIRDPKTPALATYADLLAVIFADPRVKSCPVRGPAFAYAADWSEAERGWISLVDERRRPYLVFSPDGDLFDTYTQFQTERA